MSTNTTVEIYDESMVLPAVSGSTNFGYYDNDAQFVADCPKFTKYAFRKLGGLIEDIELSPYHYFGALEDAVSAYGKEVYEFKIRENYLSLEGAPTGSGNINTTLIQPNLGNVIRMASDYGTEAGVGGTVNYYTGSVALKIGQQMYDLDAWANASASLSPGDAIEVKRVFYQIPPAVTRFFDPTVGTGFGYQNMLSSFGFGSMSPAVNFMMMPVYADVLRIQGIEFNDEIRRSAYSFELINNKLRVFPIPAFERNLYFNYVKKSERNAIGTPVSGSVPQNLITNVGNVPYDVPVYAQINAPFRKWIFEYGISVCKEILGNIRSKYDVVEIPGNNSSVRLNGAALVEQARAEKEALILSLRETLTQSSRRTQLENKAAEATSMREIQQGVPLLVYIG
jgi:hypothetical protein